MQTLRSRATEALGFKKAGRSPWQLLSEHFVSVRDACSLAVRFCDKLRLQLSPTKSWAWSTIGAGRARLKSLHIHDKQIPVLDHAVDIGAQVCYSKRRFVGLIKQRCQGGIAKLHRIAALPIFRRRREQLIMLSVWPETLHAAEIHFISKTRMQTLRSRATEALGFKKPGRSPWLACNVITNAPVDPQFVLLVNRVRLLRQFFAAEPSHIERFKDRLSRGPDFPSLATCLRRDLRRVGWECDVDFNCTDGSGRSFHLIISNQRHIARLLKSSWLDVVAANTNHRKELEGLESIESDHCHRLARFGRLDRSLLEAQLVGESFTHDKIGKFSGLGNICPLCSGEDSLAHRFECCPALQHVRDRLGTSWHRKFGKLFQSQFVCMVFGRSCPCTDIPKQT